MNCVSRNESDLIQATWPYFIFSDCKYIKYFKTIKNYHFHIIVQLKIYLNETLVWSDNKMVFSSDKQ